MENIQYSAELSTQQVYFPPPPELEQAIFDCLVKYWTVQGVPQHQAEKAAFIALERLRANKSNETWCLSPVI